MLLAAGAAATGFSGCAGLLGSDEFEFGSAATQPGTDAQPSNEGGSPSDAQGPDARDGTTLSDTGGPGDAGSGDSGTSVVFTSSFDTNCNGWTGNEADITFLPTGATGTGGACKLCRSGVDPEFVMERIVPNAKVGTYVASAFVRRPTGVAPADWIIRVEVHNKDLSQQDVPKTGPLDNGFQKAIGNPATSTANVDNLLIAIGSPNGAVGDCFQIDEVTLTYTP
jgi:hypothetical protein